MDVHYFLSSCHTQGIMLFLLVAVVLALVSVVIKLCSHVEIMNDTINRIMIEIPIELSKKKINSDQMVAIVEKLSRRKFELEKKLSNLTTELGAFLDIDALNFCIECLEKTAESEKNPEQKKRTLKRVAHLEEAKGLVVEHHALSEAISRFKGKDAEIVELEFDGNYVATVIIVVEKKLENISPLHNSDD